MLSHIKHSSTEINIKEHKIEVDILRIIAIILVIYNHTSTDGYAYFTTFFDKTIPGYTSAVYLIYMFISVLCKVAVPIFFMISGFLLLGKIETYSVIFKHRILKQVIVLVIISLLYYSISTTIKDKSIAGFLEALYSGTINGSFWFLYAYISFLLLLPFLRKMVNNMEKKEYYYLVLLVIIFKTLIPVLQYLLFVDMVKINAYMSIGSFADYAVLYPLLGYGIAKYPLTLKQKKYLYISAMILIEIVMILTSFNILLTKRVDEEIYAKFFPCCEMVSSLSVYSIITDLSKKIKNEKIKSIIKTIGSCVFGVYLLHIIFLALLRPCFEGMKNYLPVFLSIWIYILFIFLICAIITYLLKKIPGIRKLL